MLGGACLPEGQSTLLGLGQGSWSQAFSSGEFFVPCLPTLSFFSRPWLRPGPSEPAPSLGKTDPLLVPQNLTPPGGHRDWKESSGWLNEPRPGTGEIAWCCVEGKQKMGAPRRPEGARVGPKAIGWRGAGRPLPVHGDACRPCQRCAVWAPIALVPVMLQDPGLLLPWGWGAPVRAEF